jgi:hypothetical protein
MRLVIGIDEAGYGPNLGPLVIAASVWKLDDRYRIDDGLGPLHPEFRGEPWNDRCDWVPLGDSKKIYRPGLSCDGLKVGLEFLMQHAGQSKPLVLDELFKDVALYDRERVERVKWYASTWETDALPFPARLRPDAQTAANEKLKNLGLQLLGMRARVLDEEEFNRQVEVSGNKAIALGHWTMGLVRSCLHEFSDPIDDYQSIEVYCDRHGGRKRYAPMLMHEFATDRNPASPMWFDIQMESARCSRYLSQWQNRPFMIQFLVEGDSLVPSAASSMMAKWMREALMLRFNRFWSSLVGPALKPTAGYSVDASRFATEVKAVRLQAGITDACWWRAR